MYCPKKIKLRLILKEVLNHGEEVDGEDEVADGDGDVSADQQRMLL